MIRRAALVAALCVGAGVYGLARAQITSYTPPNEEWFEKAIPIEMDGFQMRPSPQNPLQSYKMTQETYDQLKPLGIVSRIYDGGPRSYDAVLIAGDNSDSFHDQRACFAAQGWTVIEDDLITVPTEKFGEVKAIRLKLKGQNEEPALAIYTIRGPSGAFFNDFNSMWLDYMKMELTTGSIHQGQFIRTIDLTGKASAEELTAFTAQFIDASLSGIDAKRGA